VRGENIAKIITIGARVFRQSSKLSWSHVLSLFLQFTDLLEELIANIRCIFCAKKNQLQANTIDSIRKEQEHMQKAATTRTCIIAKTIKFH
jgi:ABC-type microcin C transport system permease subunit YejE